MNDTTTVRTWACDSCGWKTTGELRDGDACDSCGGDLVCAKCYDHPEFCECEPAAAAGRAALTEDKG